MIESIWKVIVELRSFIIFHLIVVAIVIIGILSDDLTPTVKANSLETGCKTIGTVGSVIVARCYDDETGAIFYSNSNGWMSNPLE